MKQFTFNQKREENVHTEKKGSLYLCMQTQLSKTISIFTVVISLLFALCFKTCLSGLKVVEKVGLPNNARVQIHDNDLVVGGS